MDGDKQAWDRYWQGVKGGAKDASKDAHQRHYFHLLRTKIPGSLMDCDTLEMGCGRGTLSVLCGLHGARPSILDSSEAALTIARGNFKKQLGGLPIGSWHRDAADTDFPEKSFHVAFSVGLLEHFSDPLPVLDESIRVAEMAWHLVIGKTISNQMWYRNDLGREWYEAQGWQTDDGPQEHIFQVYRYA